MRNLPHALTTGLLIVQLMLPAAALAAPEGGTVVSGTATITTAGAETVIEASDGSILNYTGFDIAPAETVRFVQPDAAARVLNRIESASPTRIEGALLANGRVYLVNPAGVLFGADAVVDVAALYAAAGSLADADFLAGSDRFTDLAGTVENAGRIEASLIALLGDRVSNRGSILAPDGVVALVSAGEVTLGPLGAPIVVRLDPAALAPGTPGIDQPGTIDAGTGRVHLGAGDLYALAVRHAGETRAGEIAVEGGAGALDLAGSLVASNGIEATGAGVAIASDALASQLGAVTVTASDALTIADRGVVTSGGDVSLTSTGGALRSEAAENGTAEVTSAGGAVALAGGTGIRGGGTSDAFEVDTGGGALSVDGTGDLRLRSVGAPGEDLALSIREGADGDVSFASGGTGTLTLSAETGAASDVSVRFAGAIELAASEVGGNLDVTAAGGDLIGTGVVQVGGDARFATERPGARIEITELDVAGSVSAATAGSGGATLASAGALALGSTDVGGDLDITGSGGISGAGPIEVAGSASFTAGPSAVVALDGLAVTGVVEVAAGGDVALASRGALALGAVDAGGELDASANGPITNTASITVAESASFISEAAGVELDGLAVAGVVEVTTAATGDAELASPGALRLGAVDVGGDLDASANGAISGASPIAVSGRARFTSEAPDAEVSLDRLAVAGVVEVTTAGAGGASLGSSAALALGAIDVGGDLSVDAGGRLSDAAPVAVAGNASFTARGPGAAIDLGGLAVQGSIAVATTDAGGDVTLVNQGETDLASADVRGSLRVTAVGGGITDAGNLTATAPSGPGALVVDGDARFTARLDPPFDRVKNGLPVLVSVNEPPLPLVLLDAPGSSFGSLSVRTLAAEAASTDVVPGNVEVRQDGAIRLGTIESFGLVQLVSGTRIEAPNPFGGSDFVGEISLQAPRLELAGATSVGTQLYAATEEIRLGGSFTTLGAGSIAFTGPVRLAQPTALVTSGNVVALGLLRGENGNVRFDGPVDGPAALFVGVRERSSVRFAGDVGAGVPLAELVVNADGRQSTSFAGARTTPGISFGGTRIAADTIRLNAPATGTLRSAAPIRSTIAAGGDVTFTGARFEVGRFEKLSAVGSLRIVASESVRLADAAAVELLEVASPNITMLTRDPSEVDFANADAITDLGVDYVANRIVFGSTPRREGPGGRETGTVFFSTPTSNEVSANLEGFNRRRFRGLAGESPVEVASDDFQSDFRFGIFDQTGTGQGSNVDAVTLEAIVRQILEALGLEAARRGFAALTSGQIEQLQGAQPLWADQVVAFLQSGGEGSGAANGLGAGSSDLGGLGAATPLLQVALRSGEIGAADEEELDEEDEETTRAARVAARITDPRFTSASAASAAEIYRRIVSDLEAARAGLERAALAYRAETGAREIEGEPFRRFLARDPEHAPTLGVLRGYAELFQALGGLELGREELANAELLLLSDVSPPSLSLDALRGAIASIERV